MAEIFIDYKSKYLTIRINPVYDYDISFTKLKKNEDWWFNHLSGKRWFGSPEKTEWEKVVKELKENNYGNSKNVK